MDPNLWLELHRDPRDPDRTNDDTPDDLEDWRDDQAERERDDRELTEED